MQSVTHFLSPLGEILLAADEIGLVGLWFAGQKHFARGLDEAYEERETPILSQAKRWLALYFSGELPPFSPPLHLIGTEFQKEVWALLCEIPYGVTVTYGALAARLAEKRGISAMSARAVGAAVGKNPISLLVPCHRVVGSDGALTGYAGGLMRKRALLTLERASLYSQNHP